MARNMPCCRREPELELNELGLRDTDSDRPNSSSGGRLGLHIWLRHVDLLVVVND